MNYLESSRVLMISTHVIKQRIYLSRTETKGNQLNRNCDLSSKEVNCVLWMRHTSTSSREIFRGGHSEYSSFLLKSHAGKLFQYRDFKEG